MRSIFKGADGHGQQSAALFRNNPVSAPPVRKIMAGAVRLTPARTYPSALFLPQSQLFFNVQHRLLTARISHQVF